MNFDTKLKILLWKKYFDTGFGLTNNLKYIIALFALYDFMNTKNIKLTVIIGTIWIIASFFIGWWYYRKDWNAAQMEIENRVNPFVDEVRKKLKIEAQHKI